MKTARLIWRENLKRSPADAAGRHGGQRFHSAGECIKDYSYYLIGFLKF